MLKKKTLILAGAILAGAALVGGTLAAWAVTDNADPFAIKITPGDLTVGTVDSVTLEWGQTRTLTNITGLTMSEEVGPYLVGLKATTSNNGAFIGKLTASLETTALDNIKLIDYLDVKVYDGAARTVENEQETNFLFNAHGQYAMHGSANLEVTSGQEKVVSFYVSVRNGLTPAQYNSIKNQEVTLTVEWDRADNGEYVTAVDYYFNNGDKNWTNVYAYLWNSETGAQNNNYPGIAMVNVSENIWSVPVDSSVGYDKIIFNNGAENEANQKTDDLSLVANNPYYNYVTGQGGPEYDWEPAPTLNQFYLVSTNNDWAKNANFLLEKLENPFIHENDTFTYAITDVTVSAEDIARLDDGHGNAGFQFKIQSSTSVWYGEHGPLDAANVNIGTAGSWTFYFNPQGSNGTYIYCVQA